MLEFLKRLALPDAEREAQKDQAFLRRIAALNNIDVDEIAPRELQEVYMKETPRLVRKYVGETSNVSKIQELRQLTESIFDIRANCYSYGLFQPSYDKALRHQKKSKEQASNEAHSSLLLGALTPDTVREYDTTVKRVYPESNTIALDLFSEHTAQGSKGTAHFIQASALSIPLLDNSVDSVHTNILLRNLIDPFKLREQNVPPFRGGDKPEFYSEVSRILRSKGVVVFIESSTEAKMADGALKDVGMKVLKNERAKRFLYRRDMESFLDGEKIKGPYVKGRDVRLVYAQKP